MKKSKKGGIIYDNIFLGIPLAESDLEANFPIQSEFSQLDKKYIWDNIYQKSVSGGENIFHNPIAFSLEPLGIRHVKLFAADMYNFYDGTRYAIIRTKNSFGKLYF